MMNRVLLGVLVTSALGSAACSSPTDTETCAGTTVPGGNCLVFEDGGGLAVERARIESTVRDAFARVNSAMPITGVTLRVRVAPGATIPELGIGGFAPSGREVVLSFDPGAPMLDRSLDEELGPMIAHELHHARRWQTIGYGSTLRGAMVSEGLADHFSVELYGIDPPAWSTALDSLAIEEMLDLAEASWDGAYDHPTWFFGTTAAIPRWTGYAVGFELVRRYLAAEPSRRASTLYEADPRSFER